MDYRVLIFMAKDRLAAIDIDGEDVPDPVSLDGNDVMAYTSETQIKAFCEQIKEYYNIDRFSDLGMEISILRFDAVMEDAFVLMNLLREGEAGACNLVCVEKLLPWVAMKEGLLQAGTAVQIKTFDLVYTVTLGKDMVLQCSPGKVGEGHPFDFPKEKFAEYFHLGKKNLLDYEEEKREWQKKLDDALQEKKKQIGELEKQLQTAQTKVKKTEEDLAESQRVLREKHSNASRRICYLKCADKEEDKRYRDARCRCTIAYCYNTGTVISKGTKIADVVVLDNYGLSAGSGYGMATIAFAVAFGSARTGSGGIFAIKADTAGRLFWLNEPATEENAYGEAIAVIGNESDTKADVMKWYQENK